MPIALLDTARAYNLLQELLGGVPDRYEGIADLIRREVSARGCSARHVVVARVCRVAAPAVTLDAAFVEQVCDELEREGDILAGAGGLLHPAPARIVLLDADLVRFVCALPDSHLFAAVPGQWTLRGARRECRPHQSIEDAAQALGAVCIGPEVWAGLDRVPCADDEWLRELDSRLSWTPEPAASLEHDEPLAWTGLDLSEPDEGPCWRVRTPSKLWRARHRWRRWVYAWTAGAPPSSEPFVSLESDEGARTAYALARGLRGGWRSLLRRRPESVEFDIPAWLPRAEYRYLSLRGERTAVRSGAWTVPLGRVAEVAQTLATRLGLILRPDDRPDSVPDDAPPDASPATETTTLILDPGVDDLPTLQALPDLSVRAINVIRHNGLDTLGQLAACLRGELGPTRGIGRKTQKELREALSQVQLALRVDDDSSTDVDATLRGRVRHYHDLPVESLGRLQGRARSIIERHGLETIEQLAVWLQQVNVVEEPNYGRSTHHWLLARMEELAKQGPMQLVYGREVPPATADELYELFIAQLESDDVREIINGYFRDRRTLEDIAQSRPRPVSRERIRQIIEKTIAVDTPAWRDGARSILAPVERLLEAGVGVAPLDSCLSLAGATRVGYLELTALFADRPLTIPADGKVGVASLLSTDELRRLQVELREVIAEALLFAANYESAAEQLRAWGIRLPLADEQRLLRDFVGVEIRDNMVYMGNRRAHAAFVETLRAAGRALSAQEVAERVAAAHPETLASARNAVSHFERSPFVFNTGKGSWIHIENAGLTLEAVKHIADACLALVPRSGAVVSVRHLLKRLPVDMAGPPALSPYIVRDAMIHTGKVRGWRVGCDVAWHGDKDATRTSISEWIALTAEALPQPFSLSELVAKVEELSGYTRQSIGVQVALSPGLLVLGDGERVACTAVFASTSEMEDVRERLYREIPTDDVVSADTLAPRLSGIVETFPILADPRVACALARTHPEILGRTLGRLLWRRSMGEDAWSALRRGRAYDLPPAFRISQAAEWLRIRHGLSGEHVAYVLVDEAQRAGKLLACGGGWHMDGQLSSVEMVQAVAKTPDLQRLARCNQDFVRSSPIRDILNQFRRSHGLFSVKGSDDST